MKIVRASVTMLLAATLVSPLSAQQKRPLEHEDYARWNRIQSDEVSADGRWLAYRLVPGDGDGRLIVRSLSDDRTLEVPRGGAPTFTADSRYVIALIEPTEESRDSARAARGRNGRGGGGGDQPHDSVVVVDLSSLSLFKAADVQSFGAPDEAAGWMAYLLEAADGEEPAEEAEEESDEEEPEVPRLDDGTTLVVRDLGSGMERRFENVADYAFAADGSILAYTASGEDGMADGVYRVRRSGAAEAVSAGEGRYVQLAVSDHGTIAFVSDRDDRSDEAPDFALYAAADGMASARVSGGDAALPDGWAPSEHGDVSFSESGNRVFFGTAAAPEPEEEDDTPEDEQVVVDVWNWKDPYLQPMQLLQADDERERTYEAMLDLGSGRVVQLATTELPQVSVSMEGDGDVALGSSSLPYRQLISWDGRYFDLYLVDVETGARDKVVERIPDSGDLSPGGRYVTWWDGWERTWFALDTETRETRNLTADLPVPFHDVLDDHPDALRSHGDVGWTEGDEAFVVNDRFDIWMLDPTGRTAARNLTEGVGRRASTQFRYLGFDRGDDPWVPTDRDVYLSAFNTRTKAEGVYRDRFSGTREPVRLMMDDAVFGGFTKADDADVVLYTRQTFQDFPNIWVADGGLRGGRQVTDANPQQSEYLWGSAEIVEWTSTDGIPLQGILYKPEGFDSTRQYPMMVYFYERSSDGLHGYTVPAPGSSSINRSFYVSRGYLLFVPDIPYRIGYPGESAVDAVVPGVLSLIAEGYVDPAKIGVQGHSWGGYQIGYMVTRTDIFAAAEAGAPVSNMVSAYGGIRWGTGMSRMFQYERTQSRIGGSLWETPLRYIENSPIFTADKIRTPLLMMHNDGDTAVPWYQGIEFFVALRRLGKPAWLLNYNGEPHGLSKEANRKDWAIRMQQFFDHYLKDEPAPVWMEEGVPAILKGETLGLGLAGRRVISQEGSGRR